MKLLFTRFPLESAFGGAEVQTLTLMEGFLERGHSVAFAGSCPVLLSECRKRNIPSVEWHIGPPPVTKWGALSFAWRKGAMRRKLRTLLDQFHDLDAIAMLSLSEKLLLTDIAADRGAKVVWIEHDTVGRWLTRNPWLPLLKRQSENAVTVGVSEMSREMYEDLGWKRDKTVAIPNGIIGDIPVRTENDGHAGLRLLCVARLSPEKGVDVLLKAIQPLPDVMLDVVGEGRSERELKDLARPLGDRVRFLGRRDDVRRMYASYDALVLPSTEHDPFGLVAAEAMMAGIPVIVTDACGIAGYLTDGQDALIVPSHNKEKLSQAIRSLTDGKIKERIGRGGRKTAEEKFSAKKMVSAYESVFTGTSHPDGL